MAKFAPDAVLDTPLDEVATATLLTVCATQPTTYTEATATFKLADVVIDGSDFSKANGDVSGRKVTVGAQSAVPIDSSGTADHVALVRTADSTLLYVTTVPSQALTSGGTVDVGAWDIEIADPS